MLHNPSISIIIPVHNDKPWLKRAVQSLQNQTFRSYEILLVDCMSDDGSADLCDELAYDDMQIRVLRQTNSSVAQVCTNALGVARGTYLLFMGARSWCEPQMLERGYQELTAHELDLLVTGFTIDTTYQNNTYYRKAFAAPHTIYETQRDFRNALFDLYDASLFKTLWHKFYRRTYIEEHQIEFSELLYPAQPFDLALLKDIERVGCLNTCDYHIVRMQTSENATVPYTALLQQCNKEHQCLGELFSYWHLDSSQVHEFLAHHYLQDIMLCIEYIVRNSATLLPEEKLHLVQKVISDARVQKALRYVRPRSKRMSAALAPLRLGNAHLAMANSALVAWFRQNSINLAARIKIDKL